MMKFLVVLAMLTLARLSLTSAAAINIGDEVSEPIGDFEDGLKRILLDISKQIEENSNFNDYADLDIFLQENKVNDEETNFVIQEMEEFQADEITPIEDDRSRENVDSGIACAWVGRAGHCCKIVRIITAKISVCITAVINPPTGMDITLRLNGIAIWHHPVTTHHAYKVCLRKGYLKVCIILYRLYVTSHSASACFHFSAHFHSRHFLKDLGCFHRTFTDDKISTDKKNTFVTSHEKQKKNPKEINQIDGVFRFDQ